MKCRRAALLVLGALAQVDGQCLEGVGSVAGTACAQLSSCTDEAPNNKGLCKTKLIKEYYCDDFATAFGSSCVPCTCKPTCQADGGDSTPLNWRPGAANPYVGGTSSNGNVSLTQAQQDDIVKQHNFLRAYHGACPLQWDSVIAQNVIDVAPSGWSTCEAVNSPSTRASTQPGNWKSLGENVVVQSSVYHAHNYPVRQKTMSWYLESANFDYTTGATNAQVTAPTNSFTQVVWKDTTHVGCQMYQCDYAGGKRVLLACQYGPAGNVAGQYVAKVGSPSTTASGCTTCANLPSASPTKRGEPSKTPSQGPTMADTPPPTMAPTTPGATSFPSASPVTSTPTGAPSASPAPPSTSPTMFPSLSPLNPTVSPTRNPTLGPRTANAHEISATKATTSLTALSGQTQALSGQPVGYPQPGTLTWGSSTVGSADITGSLSLKTTFTSTYQLSYMLAIVSNVKQWIAFALTTTTDTVGANRIFSFTLRQTAAQSDLVGGRNAAGLQATFTYEISYILDNDLSVGAPAPLTGSVPATASTGVTRPNHYYVSGIELLTRLNGLLHHFVSPRSNGKLISATVAPAGDTDGLNVETTLSEEDFATFDPYLSTYITQIAAALDIATSRIVSTSFTGGPVRGSTSVMWTVLNTDITPAPTLAVKEDGFPAWGIGLIIFIPFVVIIGILGFLMMPGSDEEAVEEGEEGGEEDKLQEAQDGDEVLEASTKV